MNSDLSSLGIAGRPGADTGGGQYRPVGPKSGRFARLAANLHDRLAFLLLLDRARWLLWLPVGLGAGIAFYFALPFEPGPRVLMSTSVVAIICLCLRLMPAWRRFLLLGQLLIMALLLAAIGFNLAALRTQNVVAPVLGWPGIFGVEGTVTLVEPRSRGARVTLEDLTFERLPSERTPVRVRFTVRNDADDIRPGDRIAARARLQPPSGPMVPNGFDFARQAFFKQLGGIGYAFGKAEIIERGDPSSWSNFFARWRQIIAVRAEMANAGNAGPVAAALLTGLRANIANKVWSDMQASGLAHLLAISGLHMGLIAGTIYLLARYGLALIEPIALRVPVKRLAALIGMAGAAFYLGLAGAPVPTQRAFLMASIAFLAIIIDRNPISMRLVACAAALIMVFRPETLLGVSFQMSFAAVIGLVAFYESAGRRMFTTQGEGGRSFAASVNMYLVGVIATSLIATIATSPLAAYHFGKLPTYGIIANVIAVPLTAFWVMPLGLAGLLMIPLGYDQPLFYLMGLGIEVILGLASWMAQLPGAVLFIPALPESVLLAGILGGLWLCLWRQRWRYLGFLLIAPAIITALFARPADLLVAPDLGIVAHFDHQRNKAIVQRWDRDGFRERAFLSAMGVGGGEAAAAPGELAANGLQCDHSGCVATVGEARIGLLQSAGAVLEDCYGLDVVLARNGPRACPNGTPMLNYFDLRRSGGLSLRANGHGVIIAQAYPPGVLRPWTPHNARDD